MNFDSCAYFTIIDESIPGGFYHRANRERPAYRPFHQLSGTYNGCEGEFYFCDIMTRNMSPHRNDHISKIDDPNKATTWASVVIFKTSISYILIKYFSENVKKYRVSYYCPHTEEYEPNYDVQPIGDPATC